MPQVTVCGPRPYFVVSEGACVQIAVGTLLDVPIIRSSMHILVGSRAKWHQIADYLPQHGEFPDGWAGIAILAHSSGFGITLQRSVR